MSQGYSSDFKETKTQAAQNKTELAWMTTRIKTEKISGERQTVVKAWWWDGAGCGFLLNHIVRWNLNGKKLLPVRGSQSS